MAQCCQISCISYVGCRIINFVANRLDPASQVVRQENLCDGVKSQAISWLCKSVSFVREDHIRDWNGPLVHCFNYLVTFSNFHSGISGSLANQERSDDIVDMGERRDAIQPLRLI